MNYIEQFMKDKKIEVGEEFYIINDKDTKIQCLTDEGNSKTFYFNKLLELLVTNGRLRYDSILKKLLTGQYRIEKIPQKPKTVWDLKYGDDYWYINSFGHVRKTSYGLEDDFKRMIEYGNAFLTEEEAEFEVERRKCEAILLKYGTRDMMSLGNCCTRKFFIICDNSTDKITIQYCAYMNRQGMIYFESKEMAQKAIEEVTEERLKKYVFNVKE